MGYKSKAIDEFEHFLLSDLPSKIFPKDVFLSKLKGEEWYREDYFRNPNQVKEYIKIHFDILRTQLKEVNKDDVRKEN